MAYGYPPYEEATRSKLMRALAGGLIGLSSPPQPGGNFFSGLGQGFSRGYVAKQQADRAAMDYAIRQQEAQRRREEDAMQAELMKKPPKPPPERKPDIHNMTPEEWTRYLERLREESKAKGAGKGQPSQPKPPAPAKPPKPREAVMKRIDLIRQADPNNPEHRARLQAIIANPATPEERDEALKKLEISPGYYRR